MGLWCKCISQPLLYFTLWNIGIGGFWVKTARIGMAAATCMRHAVFGPRRSVGFSAAFLRKYGGHKQLQFSLE